MMNSSKKLVFVSHSHTDRDFALELQKALREAGAETFFDQDRLDAGDDLPVHLARAIVRCTVFLLLWSKHSASSRWVSREWNSAYQLRRRIVPYRIDSSPMPQELDNLVHIDISDRRLGNSALLRSVFGRDYVPDTVALFPGQWMARVDVFGLGSATFNLELRQTGQVTGEGWLDRGGVAQAPIDSLGLGFLSDLRFPVTGKWSYDAGPRALTLELTSEGFGQSNTEIITVQTTGHERHTIVGKDFRGRTWMISRRA